MLGIYQTHIFLKNLERRRERTTPPVISASIVNTILSILVHSLIWNFYPQIQTYPISTLVCGNISIGFLVVFGKARYAGIYNLNRDYSSGLKPDLKSRKVPIYTCFYSLTSIPLTSILQSQHVLRWIHSCQEILAQMLLSKIPSVETYPQRAFVCGKISTTL